MLPKWCSWMRHSAYYNLCTHSLRDFHFETDAMDAIWGPLHQHHPLGPEQIQPTVPVSYCPKWKARPQTHSQLQRRTELPQLCHCAPLLALTYACQCLDENWEVHLGDLPCIAWLCLVIRWYNCWTLHSTSPTGTGTVWLRRPIATILKWSSSTQRLQTQTCARSLFNYCVVVLLLPQGSFGPCTPEV